MALPKGRKKKRVVLRKRTGAAAAPTDRGFSVFKDYFHFEVEKKEYSTILKSYIKKTRSKKDASAALRNPEYKFTTFSHIAAACAWVIDDNELPESTLIHLNKYIDSLVSEGADIIEVKKAEEKKVEKVRLTPQQLIARKINTTIMVELDELEDKWCEGDAKASIDLYKRLVALEIKAGLDIIRNWIEGRRLDIYDAVNKTCEQAVEGYSHLSTSEKKARLKLFDTMLSDLDRVTMAAKAMRGTRKKKSPSAEKLIKHLKYAKDSKDYKVVSINPEKIIGAQRLITFNQKTKQIREFISTSTEGLQIKGSTLHGYDPDSSVQTTLRKPDEMLPIALTKTQRQFRNAFDKLTTVKKSPDNGRINVETVLLRVDK